MRCATPWILSMALFFALAPPLHGQEGLKVYISADMEGVVGVVTADQLGPGGFEYEQARRHLTEEVNTAIRAARAVGATEILVSDSHGNGQNLLMDLLPPDIRLVRSWPRPLMMMEGIDDSFDAVLFIGYHSSTTNPRGVRAHTMSSGNLTAVRLNGTPVSEGAINAAIAGHFGVPVVMISGDDVIVEEARTFLGGIEGAVVKWSHGFHSATTLMPEAARRRIEEAVTAGLTHLDQVEPYRLEYPVVLDVSFKNYLAAEILSYLPEVQRKDSHTIEFTGQDMLEISRFLEFVLSYRPDISP